MGEGEPWRNWGLERGYHKRAWATIGMHSLLVSVEHSWLAKGHRLGWPTGDLWFWNDLGGLVYNHSLRVGRVRSQTVAKLVSEHCRGEHLHLMQMWEKEQNLEGKHKSFCGHMLPFLSEIYEWSFLGHKVEWMFNIVRYLHLFSKLSILLLFQCWGSNQDCALPLRYIPSP
jgi:hypothetical protein